MEGLVCEDDDDYLTAGYMRKTVKSKEDLIKVARSAAIEFTSTTWDKIRTIVNWRSTMKTMASSTMPQPIH
ncbi:hypothetical protein IG631_10389 [Alternaria alternata]|nr:hypothetical protein IG631_10389 [Alternaria alternata]